LAWWHRLVIIVIQEADIRGPQPEAVLGKSVRLYLENKLKSKGLGHNSRGRVIALQGQDPEFNP
jgi:hypothetical protein